MKIAELFVGLGVKGGDAAAKAIGGVKTGLGETKSMALETKAAIIAVVYGLERMMSQSAQVGTSLMNFNALTGIGTKELQQWQYAARQAGVSGEELTGSIKGVQASMTSMLTGQGAPKGLAMLANKVGFDKTRARDTLYVMEQLQKFAQAVPKDVGNDMLKSFNLSEGTIAAMRRNMFTPQNFAKAPSYGEKEVAQLNRVDVAWANLGQKVQMAFGHFSSKHGMQLVKDLSKITDAVLHLADALTTMGEKWKVFGAISKVLTFFADAIESKEGTALGERHYEKKLWKQITTSGGLFGGGDAAAPNTPVGAGGAAQQNINVQQTLQFQHDGKDAKKTGDSTSKAVKDAFRQMSAQGQGS